MVADDICVFCPSLLWFQRILDMCQAYGESHDIIFNCNETVCMMFKAKSAKSSHFITDIGWSKCKIC